VERRTDRLAPVMVLRGFPDVAAGLGTRGASDLAVYKAGTVCVDAA